jgi:flagellar biosynthesis anti-sigma factor FlgM
MRIDPFNSAASQVSSDANSPQVAAQNAAKSNQSGAEDRATLSSDSASLNSLVGLALNSPAVRQDKVSNLSQSIENGEYELDPAKIASSMIDEYA